MVLAKAMKPRKGSFASSCMTMSVIWSFHCRNVGLAPWNSLQPYESVLAMVSNGVDTVLLCWHASRCPWHHRGLCLFWHRTDDAVVKPPITRTEEDIGAELAALKAAVSKMASSLMWRTGDRCARAGVGRDAGNHCRVGRGGRHLTA